MLRKSPNCVRITLLTACAKPAPKNRTPSSVAPATILHFTHAESAIASSDRNTIHSRKETTRLQAIQRRSHAQAGPAKTACTAKRTRPGIHVTCESRIASTDDLPTTYSTREKGRQKYSGSAPFATSGEIRPGPENAVRRNTSTPCTFTK